MGGDLPLYDRQYPQRITFLASFVSDEAIYWFVTGQLKKYFTLTCFRFRTAPEPSTTSPMTSSTGLSQSREGVNFAFSSLDSTWACPSFIFSKRFSVKDCARDSHAEMCLSQGRD